MFVAELIQRLLPRGSRKPGNWDEPPVWPPDLFAVTATLVNRSGIYARSTFVADHPDSCFFDDSYRQEVTRLGREWRETGLPPDLSVYWNELRDPTFALDDVNRDSGWCAALKLLAVADEASYGMGFAPVLPTALSKAVFEGLTTLRKTGKPPQDFPFLPGSLCINVDSHECCVLPKSRTPHVGCTLRNLSHNLALLPPATEVGTKWLHSGTTVSAGDGAFNVLLVPMPYKITDRCFTPAKTDGGRSTPGFVRIDPKWLDGLSTHHIREKILIPLIRKAEEEIDGHVHALVLPEGALREDIADELAEQLPVLTNLEMFITGAVADGDGGNPPQNIAHATIFSKKKRVTSWRQKKHHRWRIDAPQIRKYYLSKPLGAKDSWWEHIDVSSRECFFYVVRRDASLAVLICEDLARVDPVQSVVRSVGPNLVIALLMDDIQMERRWPGRYATVLADDPGSAVLTLTSLGLIERSNAGTTTPRYIALWKDPSGPARELAMPPGSDALLLELSPNAQTGYTSDGRSDVDGAVSFSLTGVMGITK